MTGEVVFALICEMILLNAQLSSVWSLVGFLFICGGMVVHGLLSGVSSVSVSNLPKQASEGFKNQV